MSAKVGGSTSSPKNSHSVTAKVLSGNKDCRKGVEENKHLAQDFMRILKRFKLGLLNTFSGRRAQSWTYRHGDKSLHRNDYIAIKLDMLPKSAATVDYTNLHMPTFLI